MGIDAHHLIKAAKVRCAPMTVPHPVRPEGVNESFNDGRFETADTLTHPTKCAMRVARCRASIARKCIAIGCLQGREIYGHVQRATMARYSCSREDIMSRRALELFSEVESQLHSNFELSRTYSLIESALSELVGFKLLTILQMEGAQVRRVHSSDLVSYPVGGTKDLTGDAWLRAMLEAGQPVASNTPELVQERFPDHQAIFSLGCGAVLNVPIVSGRGTLGSFNLLHEGGWYNWQQALVARPFAVILALAWSAQFSEAKPPASDRHRTAYL